MKFKVKQSLVSPYGVFDTGKVYESTDYPESFYDSLVSSGIAANDFYGNDINNVIKYINTKNLTSKPQSIHYYLYDSFYRDNSITSLGNAETNDTAYTLISTVTPVWGITNNSAYLVSTSATGRSIAYQETLESDCVVEANLKNIGTATGLAFRITDINNFVFCAISPTYLALVKRVGGVYTLIKDLSPTSVFGNSFSNDCKLTVLMKGNKYEVYVDNFLMFKVVDSFNTTATKHGLYTEGQSMSTTWDNFCVKPPHDVTLYVKEDFESDISTKWYWDIEKANDIYSQTYSTTIKNSGTRSMRFELHEDDADVASSRRDEIYTLKEGPLEEHWYGFSVYLPNSEDEYFLDDVSAEALCQWKNIPDAGDTQTSPPLALMTRAGEYIIGQRSDNRRLAPNGNSGMVSQETSLGSYHKDLGKWIDWVFHVRWGYLPEHNPITEVYKNGVLVYENNGVPNMTNDKSGVYHKIGIYKWDWKQGNQSDTIKRVVYFDNYWIK